VGGRLRGRRPGDRAASDVGDPFPGRLGLEAGDRLGVLRLVELSHTAGLSVHGYAGQTLDRLLPPIEASLSGEAGGSFPVELLEAPGRRWLYSAVATACSARAGCALALTAGPGTEGRWGLGYGVGMMPSGEWLAYHEGANRGWRAGLALLPDRRAGIGVLANSDAGGAPVNTVVQLWMMLSTKP
jgi:hypothetical protein